MKIYLAALALLALTACQPAPATPDQDQKKFLEEAQLTRVCPGGVSRIYTTRFGSRYILTNIGYKYTLEPIDPQADLKDIC